MATTTNFGWETPDDTDLVKDGALAMRTLGNAIDASLVDLKGGTTGQVLSKTSNTDMDFTWVTSDDANAIQNAIVDAKGDLITATAADTPARLAVGTDGQVLKADSSTATGLAWGSAGSSFVGVKAFRTTDLSVNNNTWTSVGWNSESFDSDGFHDNSTNNTRFTIPSGKGGKYLLTANILWYQNTTGTRIAGFYKNNGADALQYFYFYPNNIDYNSFNITSMQDLAVGDYVELRVYQASGGSLSLVGQNATYSGVAITYLGA